MNGHQQSQGTVASLHLHPAKGGEPLIPVTEIELVADKGIQGNPRYFGRVSSSTGKPTHRQVSVIEREIISEHAATLGLEIIPPGAVRSNIETLGLELVPLLGREVQMGEAILHFAIPRTPCEKMDRICQGLRQLMENSRQGVMAEVRKSGRVRVGDPIRVLSS